jgi:uncharacterized lipoprotein YbaY/uncharacterized membrane protein/membrane-bound inhibitor of C-type lysozyme
MRLLQRSGVLTVLSIGSWLTGCAAGPSSLPATLVGTATYRERMALPPGATLEVRLEDISVADASASVLVQRTFSIDGQVPIPFELGYQSDRIQATRRYGVRATIRDSDGRSMFTTTSHQPAFVDGRPVVPLELVLSRSGSDPSAAPPAAAGSLTAWSWRLTTIQQPGESPDAVDREPAYTIEFGADLRYGGRVHCNRYMGAYELPEPGRIVMSAGAATLAACPEPSIGGEYLRAVAAAMSYEIDGETLRLRFADGGVLTFTRDADPSAGATAESPPGRTFVFDCDDNVRFTVRTGPGEVALWAPAAVGGQYRVLSAIPAASGARYGDEDAVFWNRGETALIEIGGRTFEDCRSNHAEVPWVDAARRGVTFRAVGNEPSWYVEVFPDKLAVVTELGTRRVELPYATSTTAGRATTYRATGVPTSVLVERRPCNDSMSGEVFEAAVTVTLQDRVLHGCGRSL